MKILTKNIKRLDIFSRWKVIYFILLYTPDKNTELTPQESLEKNYP